jgi:hypothetical protein
MNEFIIHTQTDVITICSGIAFFLTEIEQYMMRYDESSAG